MAGNAKPPPDLLVREALQLEQNDRETLLARQLQKRLLEQNLLAEAGEGNVAFWTNSEATEAEQVMTRLWAI